MFRSRAVPVLALAAGLLLTVGGSVAQQPPNLVPVRPKGDPLPPAAELPLVPRSVAAFVSLKVADVIDHPDLKPVLEQLKKTPEALDGVTELFGVAPAEMDRVTLFWPAIAEHGPDAPVVVVTTREAYNEARVLKNLRAAPVFGGHGHGLGAERRARGAAQQNLKKIGEALHKQSELEPYFEKKDAGSAPRPDPLPKPPANEKDAPDEEGPTFPISATVPGDPLFYELDGGPFDLLFLVDERTLVFLPEGANEFTVAALLGQMMQKKPTGPLADAVAAGGAHTLAAGLHLAPLFRGFDRRLPPEFAPFAALAAAKVGTITGDLGKTAKFTLRLAFDDVAAARRAAPVLEEGLRELAERAGGEIGRMRDGRGPEKALAPLAGAALAGLKKATVKADGTAVIATTEVDAGPAAAKAVADLLQSFAGRKKYLARTNNLKQMGIALHAYHDANGKLPTNVYGPKGEPLLSWRVHLLPFLEQENLYRQFNMNEAWDGPNNKRLIEQMPKVFEVAGREAKKGETFYQAFASPDPAKGRPVGPGGLPGGGPGGPGGPGFAPPQFGGTTWLVDGGKNPARLVTISDGTSNTIGVVEARGSVIWSKPDDLRFGEKLPPLGEERADRFVALFLDGSVRALPTNIKPDVLRWLLTTNGGEVVPDLDDERPRGFRGAGGRSDATGQAEPPSGPDGKK